MLLREAKPVKRRALIATAAAGMTAAAAPATAQDVIRWNMVMPWPRNTPGVGVGAQRFADRVNAMSAGRLEIKLYAAGELVPPFEGLDAVQSGTADIAHGTPYYWVGKAPEIPVAECLVHVRDALVTPVALGDRIGHHAVVASVGRRVDDDRPLDTETIMQRAEHLQRRIRRRVGPLRHIGIAIVRPEDVTMRVTRLRRQLEGRDVRIGMRRRDHRR